MRAFFFCLLAAFVVLIALGNKAAKDCDADARCVANRYRTNFRFAAEARLQSRMRDPSSMAVSRAVTFEGYKGFALCGLVNGRNGFGGMSGEQPFVVTDAGDVFIGDSEGVAVALMVFCTNDKTPPAASKPAKLSRN